jgi:hypothetical protein
MPLILPLPVNRIIPGRRIDGQCYRSTGECGPEDASVCPENAAGRHSKKMILENRTGTPLGEQRAWLRAEDGRFELPMGSLPNRISSAAP